MGGRPLVVAGQDLELDPEPLQARDRLSCVGLRWVGEDQKAEQHELLLVALAVGGSCENGALGERQEPMARVEEPGKQLPAEQRQGSRR